MGTSDLLVPATADLLRGWTGPVVFGGWPVALAGIGIVRATGSVAPTEEAYGLCMETGAYRTAPVAEVTLDLARDEAADRCARVVAERVGIPSTPTWFWHSAMGGWLLGTGRPPTCRLFGGKGSGYDHIVPALAALNPNDDTRLPSGARLVDRLALAAVVREVCGGR